MNIEDLLNKYFEGETTSQEEQDLRDFFAKDNVPEHLLSYRAFFGYFENEIKSLSTNNTMQNNLPEDLLLPLSDKPKLKRNYILYSLAGIAASVAILIGVFGIMQHLHHSNDFVYIDGICYRDADIVKTQAINSFEEVGFSKEELMQTLFPQ